MSYDLPWILCEQETGEELGFATDLESALLGADVLSHEQRVNVLVVPREEA